MTLFLDLDGPILDAAERNFQVHCALVAELGGRMTLNRDELWRLKRAGQSSADLLALNPGPPVDRERFKRRWSEEIELPRWLALDTLQPGACATLEWLAQSWPLVLVTLRQRRDGLEDQLTRLGLARFFSSVLCANPAAGEGWETKRALVAASAFTGAGVFIGDTEVDIRAGKLLGLATVAVLCGIRDRAALEAEQPGLIVSGLEDLKRIDLPALAGKAPRRLNPTILSR
jgi:phosphoglycolate phosphatase-like HAD superfamily hydrolase